MFRYFLLFVCISFSINAETNLTYEEDLLSTTAAIQNINSKTALDKSKAFADKYPTSKMAHLMYGDLLLSHVQPLETIGAGLLNKPDTLHDLSTELKLRLKHQQSSYLKQLIPADVILLSDKQPFIIIADMSDSRVFVFKNENGMPVYENDFFMTIGIKGFNKQVEGDQKTPIGAYHFTSYIDGEELPDLYGTGAFPINYPNIWDKKHNRTGYGIWLHGSPSNTYNRAPLASNGCFVISNDDMLKIDPYISTVNKTPVLLVEEINWVEKETWKETLKKTLKEFNTWQTDWESRQLNPLMSHYSTDYQGNGKNYKQFEAHKKRVNGNKKYIRLEHSDLSIFQYPGEENLRYMTYTQDYASSNYNLVYAKEQFWKKDTDEKWRIFFE